MSEIVDKAKALVSTYEQVLKHTRDERDALRAELAKEKANASLVGTWEQAARKAAAEDGVQFVGPNTIFALSDKLRAERDRLVADNARLRKALNGVCKLRKKTEATHQAAYEAMFKLPGRKAFEDATEALAAPPAQSLASHDAALLREVANLIRQTTPEPVDGVPESFGAHQGRMYAIEQIESEADRIEKETHHARPEGGGEVVARNRWKLPHGARAGAQRNSRASA